MLDSRSRLRAPLLIFLAAIVLAGAVMLFGTPMDETPPLSESPDGACQDCNVILISIDTLRADHMSCYGYERDTTREICSFFSDGIRFENAYSQSSWTAPAHASMFTGLLPALHGVTYGPLIPTLTGHPTIFELLHDEGYFTAALYGGGYVNPVMPSSHVDFKRVVELRQDLGKHLLRSAAATPGG